MKSYRIYSQLSENETEDPPTRSSHNCAWKGLWFASFILVAVAFLILGYIAQPKPTSSCPTTLESELHCGNSSAEARALGCVFDLLTNNWMPQYCADPYTDNEYRTWVTDDSRQLGSWAFFYDDKAERQVATEEELSDLVGKHVWTTTENHLAHCVFLARRMHRLVTGEIAAVAHNTFAHTMHCTEAILTAIQAVGEQSGATTRIGSTFDLR
ncbi:hypothetical protein ZTR_10600 [Talaromyces verruculosus]|nr:hypothetical protein ZTR_10600 [Talaromyces verruculosus]